MPRRRNLGPLKPRVLQMLVVLREGPVHGYALGKRVEELSNGRVRLGPATLYRTLDRLEHDGLLERVAGEDPEDSRRVRYRLTADGRQALELELGRLEDLLGYARRGTAES